MVFSGGPGFGPGPGIGTRDGNGELGMEKESTPSPRK